MNSTQNPDSTTKFNEQPTGNSGGRIQTLGAMILAMGIVLFLSSSLPTFKSLIMGDGQLQNPWLETVLPLHIYWVINVLLFVGGAILLRRKPTGFVIAMACCVFMLGMGVFFQIYLTTLFPLDVVSNLMSTLGLRFPPTVYTLRTLFLNTLCILALVFLNKREIRTQLGVSIQMRRNALLLGLGMMLYGIVCFMLNKFLDPPQFQYFQF